jgi:hypothetical protein
MKKIFSIISLSFLLSTYAQEGVGASNNALGDSTLADGLRNRRQTKSLMEAGGQQGDAVSTTAATNSWGFWPFASQTQEPVPPAEVEQTTTGGSIWNLWGFLGGSAPAPAPAQAQAPDKTVWNLWGLLGGSAAPVEEPKVSAKADSMRRISKSRFSSEEPKVPVKVDSMRTMGRSRILSEAQVPPAESQGQGGSVLDWVGLGWLWGTTVTTEEEISSPSTAAPASSAVAASTPAEQQTSAPPGATGGDGSTGGSGQASNPLPVADVTAPGAQVSEVQHPASEESSMFGLGYWMGGGSTPAPSPVSSVDVTLPETPPSAETGVSEESASKDLPASPR